MREMRVSLKERARSRKDYLGMRDQTKRKRKKTKKKLLFLTNLLFTLKAVIDYCCGALIIFFTLGVIGITHFLFQGNRGF